MQTATDSKFIYSVTKVVGNSDLFWIYFLLATVSHHLLVEISWQSP